MSKNCSIHGCQSKIEDDPFFYVPKILEPSDTPQWKISLEQQKLWLEAIRGKPQPQNESLYIKKTEELRKFTAKVCSKHFKSGKPADTLDVQNIDWLPNQLIHFKALNKDKVAKIKAELAAVQKEIPSTPNRKSKYTVPPITKMVTRRSAKLKESPEPKTYPNSKLKSAVVEKTPEKKVKTETIYLPTVAIDDTDTDDVVSPVKNKDETSSPSKEPKTSVRYKCGAPNCGEFFLNMDDIRAHVVSAHTKNKAPVTKKVTKCGICAKQFDTYKETLEHLNSDHSAKFKKPKKVVKEESGHIPMPLSKGEEQTTELSEDVSKTLSKGENRMKALSSKLAAFDWCECKECDRIYQLFLNHVLIGHNRQEPTMSETPKINDEPLPTEAVEEATNDSLFEDADDVPSEEENITNDDYFDNFQINLWPVKENQHLTPEPVTADETLSVAEDSVVPADLPSFELENSPLKAAIKNLPNEDQPNTVRRVFFKVRKGHNKKKIYTCTACPKNNVFTDYNDVTKHFEEHYKQANDEFRGQITIRPLTKTEDGYKPADVIEYQCSVCDCISATKETVLNCIETHRSNGWLDVRAEETVPFVANEIEIDVADENVPFLPPNFDTLNFKCDRCDLRFFSHSEIYEHVKKSHGQRYQVAKVEEVELQHNLLCMICSLSFKLDEIDQAIAHRRAEHKYTVVYNGTTIKRFMVEVDGQETLVSDENIEYYKDCIVDNFVCICGRNHSDKDTLDTCYTKHTGVKQYRCTYDDCRSTAITESGLKEHISRTHEIDPKQQQICDVCGMVLHKRNVKKHAAMHEQPAKAVKKVRAKKITPAKGDNRCKACAKTFTTLHGLRDHIRLVHHKERRFQCEICFKRYLYRTNAEYCKNRHLGLREFGCNECSKLFFTKRQAQKHQKMHINDRLKRCTQCPFVAKTLTQIEAHKEQCTGNQE